jgi:hypothetical protein
MLARKRGQPITFVFVRPALLVLFARVWWLTQGLVLMFVSGSTGFGVAFGACFVAWALMSLWLVPVTLRLGLPKTTYWATRLSQFGGGSADAVFNQLRALASRAQPIDRDAIEMQVMKLFFARSDRYIRGSAIAALGVYEALTHNLAGARALFHVVQEMHAGHASRSVRAYAQAWLLAETANRGAYHELLAVTQRGPRTIRRLFMRQAALCLLGRRGMPARWFRTLCSILVPGSRSLSELLQQASVLPIRTRISLAGGSLDEVRAATFEALRLAPGQITDAELRELAGAWQVIFEDDEFTERLCTSTDGGGDGLDSVDLAAALENEVVSLLSQLWRHASIEATTVDSDPALLRWAKDTLQAELLGEAESIAATLPHAKAPATGEYGNDWRTWARLRALERAFARLLPERQPEFIQSIGTDVLNHGVWLFNDKQARMLGNDVFRWLLKRYPRDHVDYKTLKQNVKISAGA